MHIRPPFTLLLLLTPLLVFTSIDLVHAQRSNAHQNLILEAVQKQELQAKKNRQNIVENARIKQIQVHFLKAANYRDSGLYDQAFNELTKVLVVDASNWRAKELWESIKFRQKEQGLNENVRKRFGVIKMHLSNQRTAEAKSEAQKLSQFISELEQKHDRQIQIDALFDETEKAKEDIMQLVTQAEFNGAQAKIDLLLENLSDVAEKDDHAQRELRMQKLHAIYFKNTLQYIDQGEYLLALEEVNRILEQNPDHSKAYFMKERLNEILLIEESAQAT